VSCIYDFFINYYFENNTPFVWSKDLGVYKEETLKIVLFGK
jgi:hypothetical protein